MGKSKTAGAKAAGNGTKGKGPVKPAPKKSTPKKESTEKKPVAVKGNSPTPPPVVERKPLHLCALCHKGIYAGEPTKTLVGGDVSHPSCYRDPMATTEAQASARQAAGVYLDYNRRTCIAIKVDKLVTFVMREPDGAYEVFTEEVHKFKDRFTHYPSYPVERAARLYVGFALNLGASTEALDALSTLVTITTKERDMAAAKKKPGIATATKTASAKKDDAVKKTAAKKEPKQSGPKASTRFRELIMAGKHTDDQIFAIVKKEFSLDDSKRNYVGWYRNQLKKQGQKPPEPKAGK